MCFNHPSSMATYSSNAVKPSLPDMGWGHQKAVTPLAGDEFTKYLDTFVTANPSLEKAALLLKFLSGKRDTEYAPLVQGELGYLFFHGKESRVFFDPEEDKWYVWDLLWRACKPGSLTRVTRLFRGSFRTAMHSVRNLAEASGACPPGVDGERHPRLEFLDKMLQALDCREGTEKMVKECAIFLTRSAVFDVNPWIFQLQNCVLDLIENVFRESRPSDMSMRSSPIELPKEWLADIRVLMAQSEPERKKAWDILWSQFDRQGPYHTDDKVEILGDQDVVNFEFNFDLQARLLEGNPLGKCVYPWSKRGRNSKGIGEKIYASVMGDYMAPVKSTVFDTDRRNENEHSAAELSRRGVRIGFANEVQGTQWSNAVFKSKNSTDPIVARGCGDGNIVRFTPTITYVFAVNDQPRFEFKVKGSEVDRSLILYHPNRYVDKGIVPTSPRTYPKDLRLEHKIATPEFARGHLLNLVQVRIKRKAQGRSLDEIIAEGTPTSRYWLEEWRKVWLEAPEPNADQQTKFWNATLVKELHQRHYEQGSRIVFEYQVTNDQTIEGTKKDRFPKVLQDLNQLGVYGRFFFTVGEAMSRKNKKQRALHMGMFDIRRYEELFGDEEIFGDMRFYTSAAGELCDDPLDPLDDLTEGESRQVVLKSASVCNLAAMKEKLQTMSGGVDERKQALLAACIGRFERHGYPAEVNGCSIERAGDTHNSDYHALEAEFCQIDGVGRAYQRGVGLQTLSKEDRICMFAGLCVMELDFCFSVYQAVWAELETYATAEELREVNIMKLFMDNDFEWKSRTGRYYEIDSSYASVIFQRLHSGGSKRPPAEQGGPRARDILPWIRELAHAWDKAHKLLSERSPDYKAIWEMPKVQARPHPARSTWVLYLQNVEHKRLAILAPCVEEDPRVCALGYVFDSTYGLAADRDSMLAAFMDIASAVYRSHGILLALKDLTGALVKRYTPPAIVEVLEDEELDHTPIRTSIGSLKRDIAGTVQPQPILKVPRLEPSCNLGDGMPIDVSAAIRTKLMNIQGQGSSCLPWACLALEHALVDVEPFLHLAEQQGPHTYRSIHEAMAQVLKMEPVARHVALSTPGSYLGHQDGGAMGHATAIRVLDSNSLLVIEPAADGAPLGKLCGPDGISCTHFMQLLNVNDSSASNQESDLWNTAVGLKGFKKFNKPHRCSICKERGHRRETCPRAPTSRISRAKENPTDKTTVYAKATDTKRVIIRNLKQDSYPKITALTDAQAEAVLRKELKVLGPAGSFICWTCGAKMRIRMIRGKRSAVCQKRGKDRHYVQVTNPDYAHTPIGRFLRGGARKGACKLWVRSMYLTGLKTAQDSYRHLLGDGGEDSSRNWYDINRHATAFAEFYTGKTMDFDAGVLELDATKTNISRRDSKVNVHNGRFLVVHHRDSGKYGLVPLASKSVKKGAPPPPESFDEVAPVMDAKVKEKHVCATDSAQSYKKYARLHFTKKGHSQQGKVLRSTKKGHLKQGKVDGQRNVLHCTVVHKKKNFVSVVRYPKKYLSEPLKKYAASLPNTTPRVVRFKAGVNRAECVFSVLKRNMRRLNLLNQPKTATLNMLSAAWVSKNPGLKGVAEAFKLYRDVNWGQTNPSEAFNDCSWLSSWEDLK